MKWLLTLAIVGGLAFCGATIKLGKYTFFGHVKRIWASEPMQDLKEGVEETAEPATKKAKQFVEGGMKAVSEGSGSGSGSDAGVGGKTTPAVEQPSP